MTILDLVIWPLKTHFKFSFTKSCQKSYNPLFLARNNPMLEVHAISQNEKDLTFIHHKMRSYFMDYIIFAHGKTDRHCLL